MTELRCGAGLVARAFVDRVSSGDDRLDGSDGLATSTTRLRHRVPTFFPFPFLALPLHAVLVVSTPHVPHVKVASSPPVVRELYLRPVGDGDPAVGGPPDHDRDTLGPGSGWIKKCPHSSTFSS